MMYYLHRHPHLQWLPHQNPAPRRHHRLHFHLNQAGPLQFLKKDNKKFY